MPFLDANPFRFILAPGLAVQSARYNAIRIT